MSASRRRPGETYTTRRTEASYRCIYRLKPQLTYRDTIDEDESDDDFPAEAGTDEEEYEEVVCTMNMSIVNL